MEVDKKITELVTQKAKAGDPQFAIAYALLKLAEAQAETAAQVYFAAFGDNRNPGALEKIGMNLSELAGATEKIASSISEVANEMQISKGD